jgi:ABC-2 type transport system ATP-binding protein
MISARALTRRFDDRLAVENLSLDVGPGEIFGFLGPNGAGKTTTLRCIAGILPPNAGEIRIAGHRLAEEPVRAKRALAFLPDEPRLFEYLTVKEHLALVARLYGVEGAEEKGRALLAELELSGKEDALPGELSRGMKQKLVIACGFLHDPRLIVLDEPLTGLDPLAIRKTKRSLRARAEAGAALVLSSHLLPVVEELCHRVLVVAGGRAVAHGTLDEIRATLGASGAGADLEELFVRITTAAPEPLATEPASPARRS